MRFLQIADVHLGVEPDAGKPWSERRKQDIWDSFQEVVLRAGTEKVDFLLIAGDLFHRQPLKRELKEVNYLFGRIPSVKVILMAGNHDYMQRASYYCNFQWEKNVFFFLKEELESLDFPEHNVTIHGLSYWHREVKKRAYDRVFGKDMNRIHILLAHGGDEKHIPFSAKELLAQGIDYIAAGHIHKGGSLAGNKMVMTGSLEPVDCNDVGEHGYWIGEIHKRDKDAEAEISLQFCPIQKCEYRHVRMQLTSEATLLELKDRLKDLVEKGEPYVLYRIFLEGYGEVEQDYDWKQLEELPQIVDVTSHLRPAINYEKILAEQPDSLLGRYIRRMRKHSLQEITNKALEYGVSALLGHDI